MVPATTPPKTLNNPNTAKSKAAREGRFSWVVKAGIPILNAPKPRPIITPSSASICIAGTRQIGSVSISFFSGIHSREIFVKAIEIPPINIKRAHICNAELGRELKDNEVAITGPKIPAVLSTAVSSA